VCDFLDPPPSAPDADWIITNPPFGDKTVPFVLRALEYAKTGVAMFVRLQWLEGVERWETIFRDHPPTLVCPFAERVNLCKGRWDPDGTTATAYCWLVWVKNRAPAPAQMFWVPPGCREALTRPEDRARYAAWTISTCSKRRQSRAERLADEIASARAEAENGSTIFMRATLPVESTAETVPPSPVPVVEGAVPAVMLLQGC
jgi:hypothetical protein